MSVVSKERFTPGARDWLDQEIYVVIAAESGGDFYFPERDFRFVGLKETVSALSGGEWERVVGVIKVNPYEKVCYEASDLVAETWWEQERALYEDGQHSQSDIPEFLLEHHPMGAAYLERCVEGALEEAKAEEEERISNRALYLRERL